MACDHCLWSEQLLEGIQELPRLGFPGNLLVYGKDAHPVLRWESGSEESADVILAAARFGAGRLVVVSQGGYLNGFIENTKSDKILTILHKNIKAWLSDNAEIEKGNIISVGQFKPGKPCHEVKIIVSKGGQKHPQKVEDGVIEFVRKGGAFVFGLAPWNWLQQHKNKDLSDVPFSNLLQLVGIALTRKAVRKGLTPSLEIDLNHVQNVHLSHVSHLIVHCKHSLSKVQSHGRSLAQIIRQLPKHAIEDLQGDLDALHTMYSANLKASLPGPGKQITEQHQVVLLNLYSALVHQGIGFTKVKGIDHFPGDFPTNEPLNLQCTDVKLDSRLDEIHPVGFYLPAGIAMIIKTIDISPNKANWEILIGAHKDDLKKKDALNRWPLVRMQHKLEQGTSSVSSPFGGPLYLKGTAGSSIEIHLENVVESPLFDLTKPSTLGTWTEISRSPGLWTDIIGNHIRFTLPSSSVRNEIDPTAALQLWDRLLEEYHFLRGTDVKTHKKEWFVADIQPSVGYMHAGYPIVTHLDVTQPNHHKFLLNPDKILAGNMWGAFHELGHNMQRPMWTFKGTTEVTCNIFTLYGMEVIAQIHLNQSSKIAQGLKKAEKYFKGVDFTKWQSDPILALLVYVQLAYYFGWDAYCTVFRSYEQLDPSKRPRKDQDKMDQWVLQFSKAVSYNLRPLFEFWGWPLSKKIADMDHLPLFLPDDAVTDLAPERADMIVSHYSDTVIRKLDGKPPFGDKEVSEKNEDDDHLCQSLVISDDPESNDITDDGDDPESDDNDGDDGESQGAEQIPTKDEL